MENRKVGVMASIFKRTRRKPIPKGAETIVKGGKRYATWTDKRTKRPRRELLADDGLAILVEDRQYTIDYVDESGRRQRVASGTPDKDAAKQLAGKLETRVMQCKRGLINPVLERMAVEARKPIVEHLADFKNSLLAKNRTEKYVTESCELIRRIVERCEVQYLEDLTTVAVESVISETRDSGRGLATCNRMITAIKSFSRWLWRDKRTADDKLAFLTRFNEAEDTRHVRRELAPDEITWLLVTTEGRTLPGHKISGPERAMAYRIALDTGFRAGELRSLTTHSFALDGNPPNVTVQAAHSKRRRMDCQPIRGELVALLRPWLSQFAKGERVFAHLPQQTAKMFHKDLAAARAAWIAEAKTDSAKKERE
jgi:site-specific recombinase XerD